MKKLDPQTYERIIHSESFKKWFGDWEHPNRSTSKIVDKNGKPLVVYHGSPYKFTNFEYDKNSTSGQMGAEYAFWFSNISVATHYSSCYPRVYYDERDVVYKKYNEMVEKDKIDFLKSLDKSVWDDLLKFIEKEYGKSAAGYNLNDYVKNGKWGEISKMLVNLLYFVGRKHIDEISPKLSDFVYLEDKYKEKMEKELEEVQTKYDNQEGYIYPCFIKATIIEEENGESAGVGLNRIPDSSIHCKIIRNADTGAAFADEYIVTDPKRIKIATGENTTYNGKSKNIYEKRMITSFKLFENLQIVNKSFNITQKDIDDLLDYIISEWRLTRQEDIDYYKNFIYGMVTTSYNKDEHGIIRGVEDFPKTIELYRIIELDDIEDFNKNELGRFWCYDKEWIRSEDFHLSVGFEKDRDWYIITAIFRIEDIDIEDTLLMLITNTGEREIRIIDKDTKPIKYKIDRYDK